MKEHKVPVFATNLTALFLNWLFSWLVMKGSAQGLFFNLCDCTHGSERDFSFNSRTSEISRYLQVLCKLECRVPVCCCQALFYSSHWQVKVTLQGAVPLFLQGWCCFLCQVISFLFFLLANILLIDVDIYKELWCRKKKPLWTFPFSPHSL